MSLIGTDYRGIPDRAEWRRSPDAGDRPVVSRTRLAGDDHVVVSVEGGPGLFRRSPCPGCPWRTDQTGVFPAEAFLHSAETSYDASERTFACHESGIVHSAVCAGFLLRNADNNLAVRMRQHPDHPGHIDYDQVHDGGHELHPSYRAMAVANGCDPDDPALTRCRDNDS